MSRRETETIKVELTLEVLVEVDADVTDAQISGPPESCRPAEREVVRHQVRGLAIKGWGDVDLITLGQAIDESIQEKI